MKNYFVSLLMAASLNTFAGSTPGDVNFGLDISPDNHAYKFRLIVDGSATTYPTGCVSPDTGFTQALSNGAIGVSSAKLTVEASDCATSPDSWIPLTGYLDYSSNFWYNLSVDMVNIPIAIESTGNFF